MMGRDLREATERERWYGSDDDDDYDDDEQLME